jgi:hypothetical protein
MAKRESTVEARGRDGKRRRRLIQRWAIRRLERDGEITSDQAEELETKDFQSFLEWILENAPAIMELIIKIMAMFGL